jgi:hypothetical protein
LSTLLLVKLADGRPWMPHRNLRLHAARLFANLHPNAAVHRRVAGTLKTTDDLISWLDRRREEGPPNRYEEEGYVLAFEARLKELGKPTMPARKHAELRRAGSKGDPGLALRTDTALFTIWEQCVARWHAREPHAIPRSVKLILTGCQNVDHLEQDVAVLLAEDAYLSRRKNLPASSLKELRERVIQEWVTASGGIQKHLARVGKMLGQDKDHQLAELATAGGYAKLAPEMVDLALQLAGGDKRLAFFVFRSMQRIAACTVESEAMWVAEWLRGPKANPNAIPGTTGKAKLVEVIQNEILGEVTKGHSGAAGIPTTYRLKVPIQPGTCGPAGAAERLGINLNKKGLPRR